MESLLIFYGSCGHTTSEIVSSEEWSEAAEKNYHLTCSDDSTRTVYVRPCRFFLCVDCADEETYRDEFATLRFFFQSPLKGSSRYNMEDLSAERKAQTLALGKSMLPSFSEDRIFKVARKVVPDYGNRILR